MRRVRCIEDGGFPGLIVGAEYEVVSTAHVGGLGEVYEIRNGSGRNVGSFFARRFEDSEIEVCEE